MDANEQLDEWILEDLRLLAAAEARRDPLRDPGTGVAVDLDLRCAYCTVPIRTVGPELHRCRVPGDTPWHAA